MNIPKPRPSALPIVGRTLLESITNEVVRDPDEATGDVETDEPREPERTAEPSDPL